MAVKMMMRRSMQGASCLSRSRRLSLAHWQDRSWCYHCVRPLPTTPVPCGGGPGRRTGSGQLKATSDVDVVGSRTARCDRLFCSAACAASAWEQYHEPLCGLDLARIEAYASQGVTTSARSILFAWKMLGMALQHQRRSGAGAPLVPPADLPPFCHLARANDVGTAAELISTSSDLQPSVGVIGPLEQWEMIREILGSAYDTEPALSVSEMRRGRCASLPFRTSHWSAVGTARVVHGRRRCALCQPDECRARRRLPHCRRGCAHPRAAAEWRSPHVCRYILQPLLRAER